MLWFKSLCRKDAGGRTQGLWWGPAPGTLAVRRLAKGSVCQDPGSHQAALQSKAHLNPVGELGQVEKSRDLMCQRGGALLGIWNWGSQGQVSRLGCRLRAQAGSGCSRHLRVIPAVLGEGRQVPVMVLSWLMEKTRPQPSVVQLRCGMEVRLREPLLCVSSRARKRQVPARYFPCSGLPPASGLARTPRVSCLGSPAARVGSRSAK